MMPLKSPLIGIYLAGSTYPEIRFRHGDFEDWFAAALTPYGGKTKTFSVQDGHYAVPDEVDGIIITGSSASVCTNPDPWVEPLLANVSLLMESDLPILGVCFGHQVMARAAGCVVEPHALGRELGTQPLELTEEGVDNPLFKGISRNTMVQETHEDYVVSIPESGDVRILASNGYNEFQALRYGVYHYSVQFHPEITPAVMAWYVETYRGTTIALVDEHSEDDGKPQVQVEETPAGRKILQNFITEIIHGSY